MAQTAQVNMIGNQKPVTPDAKRAEIVPLAPRLIKRAAGQEDGG